MAKLVLADVASTAASPSTAVTLNSNAALIEAALENTLSRDGTSPNAMGASLDMNSNRVYNLPTPTVDHDAATKGYVDTEIEDALLGGAVVGDGDPRNTDYLGVNKDNSAGPTKAIINGNTSTSTPTPLTGTVLDIHGADSSNGILSVTSYAAGTVLSIRRSNGTMVSPTAVQTDNILGAVNASGYGATSFSSSRASIQFRATENWSDAAQGAGIDFLVTPAGSTTQASELRLTPAALFPTTDAGLALGTGTLGFGSMSLSSGATIGFANSNVVLTHSTGVLTVGVGDLRVTTAGTNTASVVTVGGTQTLTGKTLTSPTINTSLLMGSGGVINFNAGDVTITHSSNRLDIAGGTVYVISGGDLYLDNVFHAASATGIIAGGSPIAGVTIGSNNIGIYWGSGAPTVSAPQGSIYLRTDGGASTRIYSNNNGSTGWSAITSA